MGETITLVCNVSSNPPAYVFEWQYLGNDPSKVYDPCYWKDWTFIRDCDAEEDCTLKKWYWGEWVPYEDECNREVKLIRWSNARVHPLYQQ